MIQWLTYIGLAVIPFVITNGGGRYPKEFLSVGIASAIGFWAIHKGLLKPISNKFFFITILAMLVGTAFVPPSGVALGMQRNGTIVMDNRLDVDNLWNYKPILYAFVFLLMLCALSSIEIIDIDGYMSTMAIVGFIMGIVAILQHYGFNQFWSVKPTSEVGATLNPEMTSFIGHPTLTAAFVCMCILPALYMGKNWMAVVMIVAVLMTGSDFGKLGVLASIIFWFTRKSLFLFLGSLVGIVVVAFLMLFFFKFEANGRIEAWVQAINDLRTPLDGIKYGFFGYGAGAYHYANQLMHNSLWAQAHNEFIEFMFNNGIVGISLLIACTGSFIRECLRNFYEKDVYILLCIFLVICLLACGTFVWQLGVFQFYTVVILGLAYNRMRNQGAVNVN